jgi:hypothetical protein
MQNHGNTLVQLLHCLLLSSGQLTLTLLPAAHLVLSQSEEGDLIGHHLRLSNILEKIFWLSCETLYTTNASHCKQGTFLYEYPLHWVLLLSPKKCTTKCCSSVIQVSSTETSLWTWACTSTWSWTVLLPSFTHRKPIKSISAVLLPFVTYFLTVPFIILNTIILKFYLY